MPRSSEEIWPVTVFTVVATFCSFLLALGLFGRQASLALLLQLQLGYRCAVDLVRAVGKAQGAGGRPEVGEREVIRDASPAKGLNGPVQNPKRYVRGDDLYHGDLRL